jgi:hypothetical protein
LWSGSVNAAKTTTLNSNASKYTHFLVVYGTSDFYFTTIVVKGLKTNLDVIELSQSYHITVYNRMITINNNNFVTTAGVYARNGDYGNFDACTVMRIYGIKY